MWRWGWRGQDRRGQCGGEVVVDQIERIDRRRRSRGRLRGAKVHEAEIVVGLEAVCEVVAERSSAHCLT